jgi:hypothetical protein
MSVWSRRVRVSSRFALTTHQSAVFRYDGGCASKNAQAPLFARNSRSSSGASFAACRCS